MTFSLAQRTHEGLQPSLYLEVIEKKPVRSYQNSLTYPGFLDLTFDTSDMNLSSLDPWYWTLCKEAGRRRWHGGD
jgi:hypothetical protein